MHQESSYWLESSNIQLIDDQLFKNCNYQIIYRDQWKPDAYVQALRGHKNKI